MAPDSIPPSGLQHRDADTALPEVDTSATAASACRVGPSATLDISRIFSVRSNRYLVDVHYYVYVRIA